MMPSWLWLTAFSLIGLGTLLGLLRAFLGPKAPDRVVAVDSLVTITMGLMVLLGLWYRRGIYLDIALIYGALGFIATLAIARYLEGGL